MPYMRVPIFMWAVFFSLAAVHTMLLLLLSMFTTAARIHVHSLFLCIRICCCLYFGSSHSFERAFICMFGVCVVRESFWSASDVARSAAATGSSLLARHNRSCHHHTAWTIAHKMIQWHERSSSPFLYVLYLFSFATFGWIFCAPCACACHFHINAANTPSWPRQVGSVDSVSLLSTSTTHTHTHNTHRDGTTPLSTATTNNTNWKTVL